MTKSCEECLYFHRCKDVEQYRRTSYHDEWYESNECTNFKDKSKFVELPCKVGDKIYMIVEDDENGDFVDEGVVISISYQNHCWIYARYKCGLTYDHICGDNTYFFIKEEAEKALKARENNA